MLIHLTLGQSIVYSERTMGKTPGNRHTFSSAVESIVSDAANSLAIRGPHLVPVEWSGYSVCVGWLS